LQTQRASLVIAWKTHLSVDDDDSDIGGNQYCLYLAYLYVTNVASLSLTQSLALNVKPTEMTLVIIKPYTANITDLRHILLNTRINILYEKVQNSTLLQSHLLLKTSTAAVAALTGRLV